MTDALHKTDATTRRIESARAALQIVYPIEPFEALPGRVFVLLNRLEGAPQSSKAAAMSPSS